MIFVMPSMQLNSNNLVTSLSLIASSPPRWSGREEAGCSLRLKRDVSLPLFARFCVELSTAEAVTVLPPISLKFKTNQFFLQCRIKMSSTFVTQYKPWRLKTLTVANGKLYQRTPPYHLRIRGTIFSIFDSENIGKILNQFKYSLHHHHLHDDRCFVCNECHEVELDGT